LHDELGALHLLDAEIVWMPELLKAVARMLRAGIAAADPPQHRHWNWWEKAYELRMLATGGFGNRHLEQAALRFAARTESVKPLEPEKRAELERFRAEVFAVEPQAVG
jgi:hypothetical protein